MEDRLNRTSLRKFFAFQPMKKMITRLLVSVSIFSLVFSYSFSYYQNLNYFCSNSFHHIFGRAMNKNCIFFIFNGLLVFLAKTSGFVLSSPASGFDPNEMLQKRIGDGLEIASHETKPESLLEKDHETLMEESCEIPKDLEQVREEEEVEEKEEESLNQRAEDEVSIFIAESDDEELRADNDDYGSKNFWLFHDDHLCGQEQQVYGQEEEQQVYGQEEEEQEEEEQAYEQEKEKLEMLSTEELNKKFEDFIRKMKEEIRIDEVRYQLLMVN